MTPGTIVVGLALIGIVGAIIRHLKKEKDKGCGCGGNCSSCNHCDHS
ncbi:MAG: FeoB-associated Cys-rich membrane protein [Anaerotignum sp.]|nr:FeoB-associated Cys-rich membrane protein [Anaerotignum sp.]